MTTAIDIRPEMAMAKVGGFGLEGMDGLGVEDIIVPRWDILQATSKKKGTRGQFILNITGECQPEVEGVILHVSKTRVLWVKDRAAKMPECSSADGITGRTHGQCVGCEYNFWDETGIAKVCKTGYTFLCSDFTNPENLFLITMGGASNLAAKILISQFPRRKRHPYTAIVCFATVEKEGNMGSFFAHAPRIARWLEGEEYVPFRDISRMMAGVAIREVEPDVVAEATGQVPPAQATRQPAAVESPSQALTPHRGDSGIPKSDITWEELTGEDSPAPKAPTAAPTKLGNGGGKRNLPF
jgi:hypothetical protein